MKVIRPRWSAACVAAALSVSLQDALSAQISVSLSAVTPIVVEASDGAAVATNSLPAGPLPGGSYWDVSTEVPSTGISSLFGGEAVSEPTVARVSLGGGMTVPVAGASARHDLVEFRIEYTAPTATPVRFEIDYVDIVPAGAPQPRADIDVFDDGSFDYVNGVSVGPIPSYVVGPQPLVVRVVMEAEMAQVGDLFHDLYIRLLPDHPTQIVPMAAGCTPFAPLVEPSFVDTGLQLRNQWPTGTLGVFVFGLGLQPQTLGSLPTMPCLLLPQPDVALFVPQFASVHVPLPAAVRPVTLWVQGVGWAYQPGQLTTGTGYRVDAW